MGQSVGAALHRALRHENGRRILAQTQGHAHIHAGQQQAILVGKLTAQRQLAGTAIHRHIREQHPSLAFLIQTVSHQRHRSAAWRLALQLLGTPARGRRGRLAKIGVDGVQLLDHRHRCRFPLANQGTFSHQGTADAAGDRSFHRRILQVQACRLHFGLSRLTRGHGTVQRSLGAVEILAAHGFLRHQRFVTAHHGLRFRQRSLGARQLAPSPRQRSAQRRRVDAEQHLAGLHIGSFFEIAAQHDTRHTRTHLGHTYGLDAPGQFSAEAQRPGLDGHHIHQRQFLRRAARFRLDATAQHHCCRQCGQGRPGAHILAFLLHGF